MFYDYPIPAISGDVTRALVTLTPAESKRLIAKGVAAMPEVKKALELLSDPKSYSRLLNR